MTPEYLKHLLKQDSKKKKSRRRRNTKPANELTKAVQKYIRLNGGKAWRVDSQGQWDPVKKLWRKGGTDNGISDLISIKDGRFVGIEIKYGKDRLNEDQKKFKAQVEELGGAFLEVRDIDSFIKMWEEL